MLVMKFFWRYFKVWLRLHQSASKNLRILKQALDPSHNRRDFMLGTHQFMLFSWSSFIYYGPPVPEYHLQMVAVKVVENRFHWNSAKNAFVILTPFFLLLSFRSDAYKQLKLRMQWLIMGGGLNATATNLGYHEETSYVITEECKGKWRFYGSCSDDNC